MLNNKTKGAKTTTNNTKYVCVSQYTENANEISAYSVIVLDSETNQFIDGEILLIEHYDNFSELFEGMNEALVSYLAKYNCKALRDFRLHQIEYDEKGLFIWTALNDTFYKKALEEEALRENEKKNWRKALSTHAISSNPHIKIDQKAYKEAMLNTLFDDKYPFAKSLISEII